MNKQDYIILFNRMHPDFFESEAIRALPEDLVYEEMILRLNEFDPRSYEKKLDGNVSFGFYEGDIEELKKAVEKVDSDWAQYFGNDRGIYCGYIDGKAASFCIIDDIGEYVINGNKLKIGGPGCVGTLPECRHKGIGLTMVNNVTQILKQEGYDISYIHYTGVAQWYAKLGYKTAVKWNRNGIL